MEGTHNIEEKCKLGTNKCKLHCSSFTDGDYNTRKMSIGVKCNSRRFFRGFTVMSKRRWRWCQKRWKGSSTVRVSRTPRPIDADVRKAGTISTTVLFTLRSRGYHPKTTVRWHPRKRNIRRPALSIFSLCTHDLSSQRHSEIVEDSGELSDLFIIWNLLDGEAKGTTAKRKTSIDLSFSLHLSLE